MNIKKLYCGTCGECLGTNNGDPTTYNTKCFGCGKELYPKYIQKVARCGIFPGGGQIKNGDIGKAVGIITLTWLAFTMGLLIVPGLWGALIVGLIASSVVVVSAALAAIDNATRKAGYSKESPTK